MRDLLTDLVQAAAGRADYADARWVHSRRERLATRSGRLDEVERGDEEGFGVRVRIGGAWGFAATRGSDRAAAEEALARALAVAEAQVDGAPVTPLAPEPPARGRLVTPTERDPFTVPFEEKVGLLVAADAALRTDPRVRVSRAVLVAFRDEKVFASSEGALVEQVTTESGGGIAATSVSDEGTQVRSYPSYHDGGVAQAGWEHVLGLDLVGHAPRVAEQAVALLSAPPCPARRTTLILDGEQLALQLHESVGHAVELDRVLGLEAAYAGTSFLRPADRGRRYGSALMNVTADPTTPGGLGSFRWDDEGVEGRATPLVREGALEGFLSSRESAGWVGAERSSGCMRASSFARQPLVRMTNVHLEPGEAGSLEDLVADTDDGLLFETNRSWSIDGERLHFQFATELAWEIRGGERRRLLRDPSYAGVTPAFWGGLDAVCSRPEWRLWSLLNCGKGEPGQLMRVSHGTAPARFRAVQVGVA